MLDLDKYKVSIEDLKCKNAFQDNRGNNTYKRNNRSE